MNFPFELLGLLVVLLLLLPMVLIRWAKYRFTTMVRKEREAMLASKLPRAEEISQLQLDHLPEPVKAWLQKSDLEQLKRIEQVYLSQVLRMKLKPEQKEWYDAKAEQYFTLYPPAFNWSINLAMNPLMMVQGRDRFEKGKGSMLMKIWSLFAVADVNDQPKINEAALQRYLAEMVWFPTAALGPYVKWEAIDDHSAKASLSHQGTQGSGVFHFDAQGDFKTFTTMRYKETDEKAKRYKWIIEVLETQTLKGIRIPVKCQVSWELETGRWTWLEVEIKEYRYD